VGCPVIRAPNIHTTTVGAAYATGLILAIGI